MPLDVAPDIGIHHVGNDQEALDFPTRAPGHDSTNRSGQGVLDLHMPVMHGHDFLTGVKRLSGLRSIPDAPDLRAFL
ncbi:hypothetical protein [Deinococcus hohokamensis]|uniref:Uncharacterized protein n=1 Tax=Deinococcus hohokamensis TaxID=309883 RepID=A0ABV9IA79_9DEIO